MCVISHPHKIILATNRDDFSALKASLQRVKVIDCPRNFKYILLEQDPIRCFDFRKNCCPA